MRSSTLVASLVAALAAGAGCGSSQHEPTPDVAAASPEDAAMIADASVPDASVPDASVPDAVMPDAVMHDAVMHDAAGAVDAPAGGADTTTAPAEAGSNVGAVATSSMVRAEAVVSDAEKTALASGLSSFAFALMQALRTDPAAKSNFAFSPTSISLALGMAYAGAAGNTATQMKDAMRVTSTSDVYFRSLNWLDQQLESRASDALKQAQNLYTSTGSHGSPPDPASYRLHVMNACWGDRTLVFEKPYLDTLASAFGTGVRLADFLGQPDVERLAINAWVSQETLNRINDLLGPGTIDSLTRAVLVNAIHLKLPWANPFLPTATASAPFTKADGSTVNVPFLNRGDYLSYAEDETTQAVAIPLSGRSIDFVVFLPKPTSSLANFEDSLAQGHAQTLVTSMAGQQVTLALPKLAFTTEAVKLRNVLKALGMADAFNAGLADFTAMTKERPIFISDVVHKAMVGVDEYGVEAAAATAVMMAGSGVPTQVKELKANRPFFFGIYDRPTSSWLFLGHVTDPSS